MDSSADVIGALASTDLTWWIVIDRSCLFRLSLAGVFLRLEQDS